MKSFLDRRTFLRLASAGVALLTQAAHPQTKAKAAPPANRNAVKNRKNYVAIQVKPYAWLDEGIDKLLDTIQEKGNVNTVWAYTFQYEGERLRKGGLPVLPDHGISGDPNEKFAGGAFYDYDPKYFRNTFLKDFRSPDYGKFNVIREVAPKAKARGMDFFGWDYNNAFPLMMVSMPNAVEVAEIDLYGRRTISPCFNHPDYRGHLLGKIESYLRGYPGEVDGIAWGCERMGPFQNAIGGTWTSDGISCFCEHCRAKARDAGFRRSARGQATVASTSCSAPRRDQRLRRMATSWPSGGYCWSIRRYSVGRSCGPTVITTSGPSYTGRQRRSHPKSRSASTSCRT